jgi:succinyl-diaminopimelate desuccinylase
MERTLPARKIIVVPYDPDWAFQFLSESEDLSNIFKDEIASIHHIGSTAIPGIGSKPTIDILIEVHNINLIDRYNKELTAKGYLPQGEFGIPGRRFIIKGTPTERACHIHVYQVGHPEVIRHLNFRDYMRSHPEEAIAYNRLKEQLAKQFPQDSQGYNAGKECFIKEIDSKASRWKKNLTNHKENCTYPECLDDEVIRLCQRLVSIQSFNPPGNELEIATYTLDYLKDIGIQGELIMHSPQRASVIARLPGLGRKKSLLFSAHLDTVAIGIEKWQHPPFVGELADGKIWGRGASDMKSGLAAMLVAAKALATSEVGLGGDLVFAFSAGEEVDMLGANVLIKRPELQQLQAMIISEPTSNELVIAEKGILWLEVTTHGKTAHGSMPEYGRNAILMMLDFINEFNRLTFPHTEHPLLGNFTHSINTISGGLQTNLVPDQCKISIDMRTVPGQNHDEIIRQVNAIIEKLTTQNPGFSASLHTIKSGPSLATAPDDPAVVAFKQVIKNITGEEPLPKGVRYFTDAVTYMAPAHVPLIICGPGAAELAHQPDEYVEINKLTQAARIFTQAAIELLK